MPRVPSTLQVAHVEEMLHRISDDLSLITDYPLSLADAETEVATTRAAGTGGIHISFRLGIVEGEKRHHGCLLVPLADAVTFACGLMMLPEGVIASKRGESELDDVTKDALLEVGNFVTGATEEALRALGVGDETVVFEGCQGVRPDVRPALIYDEGDELVVGRARATLGDYPPGEVLLMVPEAGLPSD